MSDGLTAQSVPVPSGFLAPFRRISVRCHLCGMLLDLTPYGDHWLKHAAAAQRAHVASVHGLRLDPEKAR